MLCSEKKTIIPDQRFFRNFNVVYIDKEIFRNFHFSHDFFQFFSDFCLVSFAFHLLLDERVKCTFNVIGRFVKNSKLNRFENLDLFHVFVSLCC